MRSKLFSFLAVVMIAAMVLGACAKPTVAPTPVETEVPVVPTDAPVVEEPTEAPAEVDPWAEVVPATEIVW